MRVHFIAIGGAVMHNLALALTNKGYIVSGSDDEIFEPSRSRLDSRGLLPEKFGWFPEKITKDIDTVILGMHAREENPELLRAKEIGITIKSFPEFLYEQTKNKLRVVIGGSHGKTTITSMIMHVLRWADINFDYMVGSQIDGFETMVGLSTESQIAIFEGDEYLTSTLDRRPKFHLYKPDIAVISGIAWDHINVFPTFENYVEQFQIFTDKITPGGRLIYFEKDPLLTEIVAKTREDIIKVPYKDYPSSVNDRGFKLLGSANTTVKVFGGHNMQNISAALEVCLALGVEERAFYSAISEFNGSAKRLQLIKESSEKAIYIDFAHAPSKVRATVSALSERYPKYHKVCCVELHTFSSLNKDFLDQYKGSLDSADSTYVYFNPHAIEIKKLQSLSKEEVSESFGIGADDVFDNSADLFKRIGEINKGRIVYLFMSSGNFDGKDFYELSDELI